MKQAAAYCRLELGKAGQQKQIRDFFETCAKQENTELIDVFSFFLFATLFPQRNALLILLIN